VHVAPQLIFGPASPVTLPPPDPSLETLSAGRPNPAVTVTLLCRVNVQVAAIPAEAQSPPQPRK